MKRLLLAFFIAVIAGFFIVSTPAVSAQNNSDTTTTVKKSKLKKDGYKCVVVSAGFVECTKTGKKTYWCSGSSCVPKSKKVRNSRRPNKVNSAQTMAPTTAIPNARIQRYTPITPAQRYTPITRSQRYTPIN